ncbi:Advillin, partial [Ophiophagus hannah]
MLCSSFQKMDLVLVPPKTHGNFYEGDCYVLLSTRKLGSILSYDVHYWIGSCSSQNEQGSAAIYTIQLDDYLGGVPVQHRELVWLLYLFPFPLTWDSYKKGGRASGFIHTETNAYNVKRLLHVKGKRNVMAREVEISWDSFNLGDVFLLDLGKIIVQWNGPESNKQERLKAMLLAQDIRDRERGGRAEIGIIEGDDEEASSDLMKVLESELGERTQEIKPAISDETVDQQQKASLFLYCVTDSGGQIEITEEAKRPLRQELLNHNDCYILDHSGMKIYVWKGKGATKLEKQTAMSKALEFIGKKGYSSSTNVETVHDGAESAMFKQLFQNWTVQEQTVGLGTAHNVGRIGKKDLVAEYDAVYAI